MAVYQNLSVTQVSQSVEQNSSQVRILWESVQSGSSYNLVQRDAYYRISINGQPAQQYTVSYHLPKQSVTTLVDTVLTVPHNDKGEAVVQVNTWMDTHISAGVVELNQTLILDPIPRASSIMATDALIGGVSRLAITKRNSTYTHSVAWEFGTARGYLTPAGDDTPEEVIFWGDWVDFFLPDFFYQEIPDAKQGTCYLTITTYDGYHQVGQAQTTTFTVLTDETVCSPQVAGLVEDVNPKTLALTGDPRVLVRHYSQAQCAISATARMGAQIMENRIQDQVIGSLLLENYDGEPVRFQSRDSRGYTTAVSLQPDTVDYVKLSCEATAEREGPVSENATLYISGNGFHGSFGAVANSLRVTYSIDGGEPVTVEPVCTENHRYYASVSLTGMAYTRLYTIKITVEDALSTLEKTAVLKKGVPVFDWGENDFAFHVPVQMDMPLSMACGGTGAREKEQAWENLGLTLPMETGQEYQTWWRWQGKPVYTSLKEWDSMPNNTCTQIPHGLQAARILGCIASLSDGRMLPWGGSHTPRAEVYCDTTRVYLDTSGDFSDCTVAVQIFYTKQ